MKINGREFTFQIASDIERGGIGVEVNEHVEGTSFFVAEIFRNDSKKQIEFYSVKSELPYVIILKLQEFFEAEIPKEYDE